MEANSLEALEKLSIINKVATELKNHGYGETDADARLVSEFIIGLVTEVPNIEKFSKVLRNQANIDTVFSKNIYNLIVNMKKFAGRDKQAKKEADEMMKNNGEIPSGAYNPNQEKIDKRKKMFPGLCQADDADAARKLLGDIDPSLAIPEDGKRGRDRTKKSDRKSSSEGKSGKKSGKTTVRSKILVRLRNLVIFEFFWVKFSAKKSIFQNCPRNEPEARAGKVIMKNLFFGPKFYSKNLKNDRIRVVGPKFLNAL